MFLRFVHNTLVSGTDAREGFLALAYRVRGEPEIDAHAYTLLDDHIDWFRENLNIPDRFNKTKSKGAWRRETKGLSWFRHDANDHISRAYSLAAALESYGYTIECIRTDRVGYIVYEDDHQVVSEPFTDTPR
jgi:hypothetical protein